MREIKFRGLDELDNWHYGDLLWNNGTPIIVHQVKRDYIGVNYMPEGNHWHLETPAYKVILETVGQFTGLKDKNGVDIYEGDVLAFETIKNFNKVLSNHFDVSWDFENAAWINFAPKNRVFICGNIHENKELIEL